MRPSEVLRKAGDVLRDRGWCQGVAEHRLGQVCAIGALRTVLRLGICFGDSSRTLRDVVCDGLPLVDRWNDNPSRTFEEVLIAMDAAYVLALQGEGTEPEDVL